MATYVAIIDVGHGNSTVIKDEDETFIIDCGSRGTALIEFLEAEKINNIDSLFLSHADQDHIGGLVKLLSTDEVSVKHIYVNTDSSKGSALWDDLVYELSQQSEKQKLNFNVGLSRANGPFSCGGIQLSVVGPTPYLAAKGPGGVDRRGKTITSNSISASFHVSWQDETLAYLAGDLDEIGLNDLKDHKVSIKASLMVFPHHGGLSEDADSVAFTRELCRLTEAKTVVFSIGRNQHHNPRPEIVAAVRQEVDNVRIACTQLSRNCAKSLHKVVPVHLNSFFAKGKPDNECCGGTFVIDLAEKVQYLPDMASHQAFIDAVAATPLCRTKI
jgi:beta-lactamase superfamily II metal-dependent hydrolase